MPSTDNARRWTRRRTRADLTINTSSLASPLPSHAAQLPPPHTPPADCSRPPPVLSKSHPDSDSRALRLPSSSRHTHESFLDNPTPVEDDMADRLPRSTTQRDSHDLSLSPRNVTRDSLVTNMLLSLDQFSMGQLGQNFGPGPRLHTFDDAVPQFGAADPQQTWTSGSSSHINNNNGRAQNGHQHSYSSDLEGGDDSSRLPSSRGRRSNSSSNFQSGFRLNSVRESVPRTQTSGGPTRALHSRGGKPGSKSSSTTSASIDGGYAQVLGSQRWTRGYNRPASVDYSPVSSPAAPAAPSPPPAPAQHHHNLEPAPFRIEFSNTYLADEYDAAPNPTIPPGPRRESPAPAMHSLPPPPPAPLDPPPLEHKRSSRSLRSVSARNKSGNLRETAPPTLPALDLDSAPAPHVGYEKSKDLAVHGGSTPAATPTATPVKDRPGFFRRVFGSRSASHGSHEPAASSPHSHSAPTVEQPASHKLAHSSTPPSRDRDTTSSHSHHPTLQKRPSSFFRRRKKSATEEPPPLPTSNPTPPMPNVAPINVAAGGDRVVPMPEPSPVSSLRKVMNPYLRTAPGTAASQGPSPLADISNISPDPNDHDAEGYEYKRGFSPDYSPPPNAGIRPITDIDSHYDLADTPSRAPPQRPTKPAQTRNNSFLDLDGPSDNEPVPDGSFGQYLNGKPRSGVSTPKAMDSPNPNSHGLGQNGAFANRVEQTDSEDDVDRLNLALPIEGARSTSPVGSVSTGTDYKSALSAPPSVRIESSGDPSPKVLGTFDSIKNKGLDEPEFVIGEPTEDDRQKAQKIFDGNEDFIAKEKAASWMGEEGPIRQRTLQAYMELYDFTNQSVVYALRQICGRLVFRAETQQVDRILVAFSKRWCDCNPNHGFKATDVIHTICYSIMLLNTDLHVADIEHKMTRGQFIKNTMGTITQAVAESVPEAFNRPSILPDKNSLMTGEEHEPQEHDRRSFRHSFRPPPRFDVSTCEFDDGCGPLVKAPFNGSRKAWEEQIEVVLKDIYASIRDERLPLFGAEPERNLTLTHTNSGGLSVKGMLKRTPSVLSKAPSESQLSVRGRINENSRNSSARWVSKSRSRNGIGARNGFSSSRTSFDDGNSIWSPASSSATWSRHSLGRTQTSMSQDSFGSAMPRGDYQQSIGFANALSQAIIRDEDLYGDTAPSILSVDIPISQLLEDDSLELAGPPWVKEGMVIHKHHLDGVDKKAKDRHWTEVFAVIQKGQLSLFSFTPTKSMRQKNRKNAANVVVGGGNWQDNATNMGTFNLRQTLASALPPPGYSRSRPHVWALSLPTGAVHLFQVGTPEISKEFVNTVNYWSARLSTHPLVGGISNIEYGWSDAIVNNALVTVINETGKTSRPCSSAAPTRRSSVTSASFRGSSFDHITNTFTNNSGQGKLPGDRIHISNWTPPTQSMRPSNMSELEQLETLDNYVKSIEAELQTHNQLRSPMLLAFTPRGANANKAMANWERKSAYLLREIVKFRTYVDCLQQAETRKQEIYAERDLAQRAARGELSDGDMDFSGEEGDITLRP